MKQGHKRVTVAAVNSILPGENGIFNMFRQSIRNASRILWEVGNESILMGTECFNNRFSVYPAMCT